MTDLGIRIAAITLMAVVIVHSISLVQWTLTALDRREWFKAGFFGGLLLLSIFAVVVFALNL
jgi:uncharacterized membrane protein